MNKGTKGTTMLKTITRALLLSTALGGLLTPNAFAANAHVQAFPSGHSGNLSLTTLSTGAASAVGAGDNVVGMVSCWVNNVSALPTVSSIVDNGSGGGNAYKIADTGTTTIGSNGGYRWATFYFLGINNAPTTITVNWSSGCRYTEIVADEFSGSLSGLDAHIGQGQSGVASGTDVITSGNVTPTSSGELVYGASIDGASVAQTQTADAGWVSGTSDQTANDDWGYTEWKLSQGATSLAANFNLAVGETASQGAATAIMTFAPNAPPTPVSVTGCVNPTVADNSVINTVVCNYTVNMSDLSTFNGTTSVAQQGCTSSCLFQNVGTSLELNRAAAVTDDGIQVALYNFAENGVNLAYTVNVQVTPVVVSGTPISFGFKGINPGTSETPQNGTVIFTAPREMAVMAITGRATEVIGGTGMQALDVYKASSGTPCASGVKLHTGDFNANGPVNVDQPLAIATIADTSVTGNTHSTTTIDGLSANVLNRGWAVGNTITGSGIPANDTIASIAAGGLSLTLTTTASATANGVALTDNTLPLAQGDNVCVITNGASWANPASVDATITVTVGD